MNGKKIHERNCGIVQKTLEKRGYKCEAPIPPVKGVDFVVTPPDGGPKFKLQVRSRVYLIKEYCGKKMRFAFPEWKDGKCFICLYCLDEMVQEFLERWKTREVRIPKSWNPRGVFHVRPTPTWIKPSVLQRIPKE